MKLMFNKKTYEGHWFNDDEAGNEYTEKIPQNTGYEFSEEKSDWVLKQETGGETPAVDTRE